MGSARSWRATAGRHAGEAEGLRRAIERKRQGCLFKGFSRKSDKTPLWCSDNMQDVFNRIKTSLDSSGPMPAPRLLQVRAIPDGQPPQRYFSEFMGEFGAESSESALFDSVCAERLLISRSLFLKQSGAWKIEKRGRASYVLYLAEAIKQPDEVWLREDRESGKAFLDFLARFSRAHDTVRALAVFQWSGKLWEGVTAHPVDREIVFDSKRQQPNQILIYRRE